MQLKLSGVSRVTRLRKGQERTRALNVHIGPTNPSPQLEWRRAHITYTTVKSSVGKAAVMSTYCFYKRARVQHLFRAGPNQCNPVPGDLVPSSGLLGHCSHMYKHIQIDRIKNK